LISIFINIALGLQVLIGALITGIAAAASPKTAQISTSILGGFSTVIASFLARMRGSGEPEESKSRAKELQQVRQKLLPSLKTSPFAFRHFDIFGMPLIQFIFSVSSFASNARQP
jgi:hypothetical protein